jgi:hypothetical protein
VQILSLEGHAPAQLAIFAKLDVVRWMLRKKEDEDSEVDIC